MKHSSATLLLALLGLAFLLIVPTASAGGWAVVTLDAMPAGLVVNRPVTVSMTIRQHGQTLWDCSECVRVRAQGTAGSSFLVSAQMLSAGHYTADLTFPRAGEWQWAVASGLLPEWQPMPSLQVAEAAETEAMIGTAASAQTPAPTLATMWPALALLGLGVLGFVGSGGGLLAWFRSRR